MLHPFNVHGIQNSHLETIEHDKGTLTFERPHYSSWNGPQEKCNVRSGHELQMDRYQHARSSDLQR